MAHCAMSLQEHVEDLMVLLMNNGFGGGCELSYQAMLEVAEAFRLANQHPEYTPVMGQEIVDMAEAGILGDEEPPGGWN